MADSIFFGSKLNVSGSISTKIGLAFLWIITLEVAANVKGVVITSSPSFIPSASNYKIIDDVPEFTATVSFTPR